MCLITPSASHVASKRKQLLYFPWQWSSHGDVLRVYINLLSLNFVKISLRKKRQHIDGKKIWQRLIYNTNLIRHSHISLNAPYLPPKILPTFVFHFSWVLQLSQEKLKTMLVQTFGVGANEVHYGRRASGLCKFLSGMVFISHKWQSPPTSLTLAAR